MDDSTDWHDLVTRVRQGDPSAERTLVETLLPQVYARIGTLLPRRSEIEDLSQEVFSRVFAKLSHFKDGIFPAWVDTITRRICYDALRKQKVRPEWRFADLPDDPQEMADSQSRPDQRDLDAANILQELFTLIPAKQAYLLDQVELKERSIGEVSQELGWTATAGRLRLFRARKALQRAYQNWNDEPRQATS